MEGDDSENILFLKPIENQKENFKPEKGFLSNIFIFLFAEWVHGHSKIS